MRCDIIAYEGKSLIDKLIRLVTKKKISHVSIMLGTKYMMESMSNGVKLSKFSDRGCKIHVLRCPQLTSDQKRSIIKFILNSVDVKYDYRLIVGIFLNKIFGLNTDWDDKDKYICNELITEAFKSVGINLFPIIGDKNRVPGDILESPILSEIDLT